MIMKKHIFCFYFSHKFLTNKVVSVLQCHQCNKPRCIYGMKGELSIKGRQELEDIIFTCGADFRTPDLYTANIVCNSPVESTFYSSRPKEQYVCLHCGTPEYSKEEMNKKLKDFNSVFPVCIICKEAGNDS